MRLAIVGCAHIHTQDFVERLRRRRDIESFRWQVDVRWVWDHDAERAARVATALGPPAEPTTDLDQLLDDAGVEAVIIASENDRHTDLIGAAVEAGLHVFVDKPLALAPRDAYGLAAAIDASGRIFQTGYLRRSEPAARFLRQQITEGHLGTVTRARVVLGHNGALEGWFDHDFRWMTEPDPAGFGAFGDVATHSIDLLRWLLSDRVPVARVAAALNRTTGRYPEVDEYGEGLLEFTDGTIGSVAGSWVDRAAPMQIEVSGTEGHALLAHGTLHYFSDHLDGADGRTAWTALPPPLPHPIDLYLDALLGDSSSPLVSVWEAADRVALMHALQRAAATGEWARPMAASDLSPDPISDRRSNGDADG